MSRRSALALGLLWLGILGALDAAILLSPGNLRKHISHFLDQSFSVHVSSGDFRAGWFSDIVLEDVVVPRPGRIGDPLFSVDEIRIDVDWWAVLLGRPSIDLVTFKGPRLNLEWTMAGALDLPSPFKPGQGGAELGILPKIRIQGLSLGLKNAPYLARRDKDVPIDDLLVELVPKGGKEWRYDFEVRLRDRALGEIDAHGHVTATDVGLEFSRSGFEITDGLKGILAPDVVALLGSFSFDGRLDLVGSLDYRKAAGEAFFAARADFGGARISFRDWPQQLNDVRGTVRYERGRLFTDGALTGELEGGALSVNGSVDFTPGFPKVDLSGVLRGLRLDDEVARRIGLLPAPGPEISEQLFQFEVRGLLDAEFRLGQRPGVDVPGQVDLALDADLDLRGCRFAYRGSKDDVTGLRSGFPYPLTDMWGTVHVTDRGLDFKDLRAGESPTMLHASGRVDYEKAGEETWDAVVAASRVPLDARLLDALDPATRSTVERLHARGQVKITVVARRKPDDPPDPPVEVTIDFQGLSLEPEAFPYLLEDAGGRVLVEGSRIRLEGFTARHATGTLGIDGTVGLDDLTGELALNVNAKGLVLDESFMAAIGRVSPAVGSAAGRLGVSGRADVDVEIESKAGQPVPWVKGGVDLDGVVIATESPPVRLEGITGHVEICHRPGLSEFEVAEGLQARIAGKPITGAGRFIPGKGWYLKLLSPGIDVDASLLAALEGVFPFLADPENRPGIEGLAAAEVRFHGHDDRIDVEARVEANGMRLRPAGWQVWMEGVYGTLVAKEGKVRIDNLVAVIDRPKDLEPLPPVFDPETTAPFQPGRRIEVGIQSCEFLDCPEGAGLSLSGLSLGNIPLEHWILDLLDLSPELEEKLRIPNLTGMLDLSVLSAIVKPDYVVLNEGAVELLGIHLGVDELYLERGRIEGFSFVAQPNGDVKFEGRLVGRNFRVLGVPVPRFEGQIDGDNNGVGISRLGGVLFGYRPDRFVLRTATLAQLRRRAEEKGYLRKGTAAESQEEELRRLIANEEMEPPDDLSRNRLIEWAAGLSPRPRDALERLSEAELRDEIKDAQEHEPLGRLEAEGTGFGLAWSTGRFNLRARLHHVNLAETIRILGGDPQSARGRVAATLELGGLLEDPGTYTGSGKVAADAFDIVRLPVFLNILKALLVSFLSMSSRSQVAVEFDVRDRRVNLTRADITSDDLDLHLAGPGVITFGGVIDARFDVNHKSALGIPLISDILGFLPSVLLGGVEVQGPLEDPMVIPRSMGASSTGPALPQGRRPVLKDPKDH